MGSSDVTKSSLPYQNNMKIIIAVLLVVVFSIIFILAKTLNNPYKKIVDALNDKNWVDAIKLCSERRQRSDNEEETLALLLYARIRQKYDLMLTTSIQSNNRLDEDYSVIRTMEFQNLISTLNLMICAGTLEKCVSNHLLMPESDYERKLHDIGSTFEKITMTSVKDLQLISIATKIMCETALECFNLEYGDDIDRGYYLLFLALQSAMGKKEADERIVSSYLTNIDTGLLFKICGSNLEDVIKQSIKTTPKIAQDKDVVDYITFRELVRWYSRKIDASNTVSMEQRLKNINESKSDESREEVSMVSMWLSHNYPMLTMPINLSCLETLLANGKPFRGGSAYQVKGINAPIPLLCFSAYDMNNGGYITNMFSYHQGDYYEVRLISGQNINVSSSPYIVTPNNNQNLDQCYSIGKLAYRSVSYSSSAVYYNPRLISMPSFQTGYVNYIGGMDVRPSTELKRELYVTDVKNYSVIAGKATIVAALEDYKLVAGDTSSSNNNYLPPASLLPSFGNSLFNFDTTPQSSGYLANEKQVCPLCHGSKVSLAADFAPGFGLDYEEKYCPICDMKVSTRHYHPSCKACGGTGYRL